MRRRSIHWLYGALVSVALFICLFVAFFVCYRLSACFATASNTNATELTNDAMLRLHRSSEDITTILHRFWTYYGRKECGVPTDQQKLDAKQCSAPYDTMYCFNGGECIIWDQMEDDLVTSSSVSCKCRQNYYGHRCEYIFDSEVYDSVIVVERTDYVETAAFSGMPVALTVIGALTIAACAVHFRLRFCCTSQQSKQSATQDFSQVSPIFTISTAVIYNV